MGIVDETSNTEAVDVAAEVASGYHLRVIVGDAGRRHSPCAGGSMSSQEMIPESGRVRLNEEDVAYLMNLLRNATQPVTTQQLIDALRKQSSQLHVSGLAEGGLGAS